MHTGSCALVGQGILGWVTSEREPLWVELLCDGCVLAIARADKAEPKGCGFYLPIPAPLFDDGATVSVRIANTDEIIGQAITIQGEKSEEVSEEVSKPGEQKSTLLGEAFVDRGLMLRGWVFDTDHPEKHLTVFAVEHGMRIAQAQAEQKVYGVRGETHGFTLTLPPAIADGEVHSIHITDSSGRDLPGSPVDVCGRMEPLGEWFANKTSLTAAEREFLTHILNRLDRFNPGALLSYETWKSTFPAPRPLVKKNKKISLRVIGGSKEAVKKQKGVDIVFTDDADYTLILSRGDILDAYALCTMLSALKRVESETALLYADSECVVDGTVVPLLKPAWNRALFLGTDYLGPLLLPKAIAHNIPEPFGAYSAYRVRVLRYADENARILHLPEILSRTTGDCDRAARKEEVDKWLADLTQGAHTEEDGFGLRIRIDISNPPRVSIVIPTRDHADLLRRCLDSLEKTDYAPYEVLVVDNDSKEPEALAYLASLGKKPSTRVLTWPGAFNFSAINNFAAQKASGDILCFLNNDTEILHPEWLREMVSVLAANESVGCVGAKLLWPNHLVQHGGVIVGMHDLAGHVGNMWLCDEPGYMRRNQYLQEFSAVTAACMLTWRKLFLDLSGFDTVRFPVAFNDVDYCLRLRARGKKILWTPHARLMHHESASRGKDTLPHDKARSFREMLHFRTLWGTQEDRFYNPNLPLSTVTEPFLGLALPPRPRTLR
ncbi:MAG: glycosyltransferase family 2 protein [Desulfovibrionaceae bacterium]|nr:glycosyltransferase family 2 protein [Desulfovibrionaceae bacterium]